MTYRQALAATTAKVIHIKVQLCLTSCYVLVIFVCMWIWFGVVLNSVIVCANLMWNVVPLGSVRDFFVNFRGLRFKVQSIHELTDKVRFIASLLEKNHARKNAVRLPKESGQSKG